MIENWMSGDIMKNMSLKLTGSFGLTHTEIGATDTSLLSTILIQDNVWHTG